MHLGEQGEVWRGMPGFEMGMCLRQPAVPEATVAGAPGVGAGVGDVK